MQSKHAPIISRFPHMLHGGDYSPEQWRRTPEVWDEDMRLMKLAGCNTLSIGIFSWSALEPEEGVYDFSWMDTIMDNLHKNGAYAVLATPSAARPAWMAAKYPEVLRVNADRQRILFGERHNHCYSSPIYREKTQTINRLLAERYKDHPALGIWHISNEYGGECHCPLCQENFRLWLREKYGDLDKLNEQWWTGFWSHTYTDWSQIESPAPHGENSVHGLALDWKRFCTYMTGEFLKSELVPIREITPDVPVTTNFMGNYYHLDYPKLAPLLDVISWDSYPFWTGGETDAAVAMGAAFNHDAYRAMKGKPFMLMESTPSTTNWRPRATLKRPNQHLTSSLQAVAHGADTVQYFQWRKSRGSFEKFHGAVVDHTGDENNRVFRDVASVGDALGKLDSVVGTAVDARVAVIFDRENWWALSGMAGLVNGGDKGYLETVQAHYNALWKRSIAVDVVSSEADLSIYSIVIAPMLYMIKPGVAERLEAFVSGGGTYVATYWSGVVNENDLCFLGGFPGPLRRLIGVWAEEIDTLPEGKTNTIRMTADGRRYSTKSYCELPHLETAAALGTYDSDFYAGMPAVTVNAFGEGKAYYIAFEAGDDFLSDFYDRVLSEASVTSPLDMELPPNVSLSARTDGESLYCFFMSFSPETSLLRLPPGDFSDMLSGKAAGGTLTLEPFGTVVLRTAVRG